MQRHELRALELLEKHRNDIKNVLNIGIVNLPDKMYELDTAVRLLDALKISPLVTHLEIFERNCEIGKVKYPTHKFINGDVRKIENLTNEKFNFIFWWHGPEHVYEHELVDTITKLESYLTDKGVIILGSPDGWQEQHNEDGNIHNDHYSGPDTDFYQSLNYEVYKEYTGLWSLIAYKSKK